MGIENPLHIAVLVVILLLVFGAKRLPEMGRSLGGGMREFKQSINGESHSHDPRPRGLNAGAPETSSPEHAPALPREPATTDQI